MIPVAEGWQIHVDESPEWLFVRLTRTEGDSVPEPRIAQVVWDAAQHRGLRRLVFELDGRLILSSFLVGQLVLLHKRAELEHGVFRLCGISDENYRILRMMHLSDRFPNYRSREDAVLGRRLS
jgi:anti-anti-sigma regulatory factor